MFRVVLLCVIVFAAYFAWINIPIVHGYGELVTEPPSFHRVIVQEPFIYENYKLNPIKVIEGNVRVLDKKRYFFDRKSDIAPVDIVTGWQKMSDEAVLDDLYFIQSKRIGSVRFIDSPVPRNIIESQAVLWHLIPANDIVARKIHQIREGHILKIEGWTVDVESSGGHVWNQATFGKNDVQLKRSPLWVMDLTID